MHRLIFSSHHNWMQKLLVPKVGHGKKVLPKFFDSSSSLYLGRILGRKWLGKLCNTFVVIKILWIEENYLLPRMEWR